MKIEAKRDHLLKPMQQIISAVEGDKSPLPILSHVKICARDGEISWHTTDLAMGFNLTVPHSMAISHGEVTIPAKRFLGILKALPPDLTITLTVADDKATLRSGRSRFSLATLPVQDFPSVEGISDAIELHTIVLPQSQLREMIQRTRTAIAIKDVRYYLNGLCLEIKDNALSAIATDGHRLSYDMTPYDYDKEVTVIVPHIAINEIFKLLSDTDDPVTIRISDRDLRATVGGLEFVTKLIDGKFPDYHRVIPKPAHDVGINRALLMSAVAKVSTVTNKPQDGVKLKFSTHSLHISAVNSAQEEAEDEIEIEYAGDDITIGLNPTYLMDALNGLSGESIIFSLTDDTSSVRLTQGDDSPLKYVIMPMRI